MKIFAFFILILTILIGQARHTFAQQSPVQVDKFTNHIYSSVYSATIVPRGTPQVDIDFVYNTEPYSAKYKGSRISFGSLPDLKLRYGLLNKLELRLGTRIGFSYYNVPFPGSSGERSLYKQTNIHTDYLTFGLKANILNYNQEKGFLSILAESHIPILRPEGLFDPSFLPTLTLINANQLNHWLGYNLNAGSILLIEDSGFLIPGKQLGIAYNLSLSPVFTLHKRLSCFTGINLRQLREWSFPVNQNYHAGIMYTTSPSIQLRGSFSLERQGYPHHSTTRKAYHYNLGMAWRVK